ncbi:xanthine dehydrogenase family protein molybdopterin-binding subunit [Aquabacterium sp. J223]|uniref:xanthine dehydrogenase family protein molybdopterin-binding subunit n=1 Tax=Aquabacterium sp. J223 TaxID=2898431 RepID=UPI0021ADA9C9|nr:molybdopterin cofactor-binding domain-containing protein [Aquabacterium sp. J223]UUX95338.1 molybdopterin-dependent oxidoreductase [Aquabacterium sp. J223]
MSTGISRRGLLTGAGVVVAFSWLPGRADAQPAAGGPVRLPGSLNATRRLDAWVRLAPDGSAVVCTGKVEFGQGVKTALAQIAAEELELPLSRLSILTGDTDLTPDEGFTAGSMSIEFSGSALRAACAEARELLVALAAERLAVPAAELRAADGAVVAPDGRRLSYGELAGAVDLKREASPTARAKPASLYRLVGQSVPRLDIPAKVTGATAYIQDLRLPGMVHARVVRPPRPGARLERVDEAAVRRLPGVLAIVRDGSFLGVVARREEQAIAAWTALREGARWSGGEVLPTPERVYQDLLALPTVDTVVSQKAQPVPDGAKRVEATYRKPYVSHGSIGPSCALAQMEAGRMTVWTHSQGVFPLRRDLARALGMKEADVRCTYAENAGCYGRNGADDAAFEAALIAKTMPGRPVRLQWMREDEFTGEPYGTAMVMKASGAVANGRIVDWQYELWSGPHGIRPGEADGNNLVLAWSLAQPQPRAPARNIPAMFGGGSERNAVPGYDVGNHRVVNHFIPVMPVWVSSLRTLGAYGNVLAVESFMDELAEAAGADPVAFRLAHLKDERGAAVIRTAAEMAQWSGRPQGDGRRGFGIGYAQYKNTAAYVAVVAEVIVDRDKGLVRVPRVWCATDAGTVINPDGVLNQIEGGVIQSVSWTLLEEVRMAPTGVQTRHWGDYPILRMPDVPRVEHHLARRTERPLGTGEASQGPAAAAVANAFAAATGRRLREAPFTPSRVRGALA